MISNPYANLSVATKAAEMQAEEADISLANTLDTIRQTGMGAGGATALAQAAAKSKSEVSASDTVVADVWNRTSGNLLPFIFTSDGSSTAESDYLFARFGQSNLDMTQVANDVFNISMRIEEEF